MKRRSFIGWLALSLLGCKSAITQAVAPSTPEKTPSPSPTFGATESPSPVPSVDGSGATQAPTPIPTPETPIVLDSAHVDTVAITHVTDQPSTLFENGRTFTIQSLGASPLPSSLPIQVLSDSQDIRLYRSDAIEEDLHLNWQRVPIQVDRSPDGHTARVTIQSVKSGRHLITGKETTAIPTSIEYTTPPITTAGVVESVDFPNDAAVTASYTVQEYVGVPYYSSVDIPPHRIVKGEKTVVVFVHGAGFEQYEVEQYLWRNYLSSVATGVSFAEFRRRFIVALYRYDSLKPIDANADDLITMVAAKYGTRNVILVGHSMGGMICRLAYAKKFSSGEYKGIITLGSPHLGSPLAVPKLMEAAFSTQPDKTRLTIVYKLMMSNLFNAIKSLAIKKRVSDLASPIAPQCNEGMLSLAARERHFGIPTATFIEHYSIGLFTVPILVTIDQTDERVLKASSSTLYPWFTRTVGVRQENGVPMVNQIELLEAYERSVGCDTVPHVIPYGATIGGSDATRSANALLDKAKTVDGIKAIVADSSRELQQQFLRWVAGPVNSMIPTATGRRSLCSDGFVRLEDALGLFDGNAIATLSLDGLPKIDMTVVQKRKSPWVRAMRIFPQYTHLDLAIGRNADNAAYFDSITQDLFTLDDEIQVSRTTTLSTADIAAIQELVSADFTGNGASWSAMLVAARGGPNRAKVSLRTRFMIDDVYYYQFYYVYVQKVGNTWRYQTAKQYVENGRVTTLQPPPQP